MSRQTEAVEAFEAGVHDHYKGGMYTALFLATGFDPAPIQRTLLFKAHHHDTRQEMNVTVDVFGNIALEIPNSKERPADSHNGERWVIYVSHKTGAICARPLALDGEDSWIDEVVVERPKINRAFGPDEDGGTERRPRFRRLSEQPT
jgi:hypothetical protein